MKLVTFDLTKHEDALRKLNIRKSPNYIKEAYLSGFTDVVNLYYYSKLKQKRNKSLVESKKGVDSKTVEAVENSNLNFLKEAMLKRDEDFLKAFFLLTNLDIFSGNRLPPNASSLIKQGTKFKGLGLEKLYKKLI